MNGRKFRIGITIASGAFLVVLVLAFWLFSRREEVLAGAPEIEGLIAGTLKQKHGAGSVFELAAGKPTRITRYPAATYYLPIDFDELIKRVDAMGQANPGWLRKMDRRWSYEAVKTDESGKVVAHMRVVPELYKGRECSVINVSNPSSPYPAWRAWLIDQFERS